MKKMTAAFLCALMLITAAGCGNENTENNNSAETSKDDGTVSIVAAEAKDSSESALKFLSLMAPKFRNYLDIRRTMPLTLETTVYNTDGVWTSNLYVKDGSHAVQYSKDPAGNELRVIYSGSTVHQIESATKMIYSQELGEDFVTSTIASYMLPLYYSDVANATYSKGTGTVEDVEYNCESIQSSTEDGDGNVVSTSTTVYYFEKDTDRLVYTNADDVLTKIGTLENKFDRDDLFELPEGYTVDSIDNLMQQYMDEEAAQSSGE